MSTRATTEAIGSIPAPDFAEGEPLTLFSDVPVTFIGISGKRADGQWVVRVQLRSGSIGIVSARQLHRVAS